MTLTDGVSRIGPQQATQTEAQHRAEHDRAMFLLGVEFGFCQHEKGKNLDAAMVNARALPLFKEKP